MKKANYYLQFITLSSDDAMSLIKTDEISKNTQSLIKSIIQKAQSDAIDATVKKCADINTDDKLSYTARWIMKHNLEIAEIMKREIKIMKDEELIKIYAITGTLHGSLISALSEGAARRLFHKYYNGESITHVHKHL